MPPPQAAEDTRAGFTRQAGPFMARSPTLRADLPHPYTLRTFPRVEKKGRQNDPHP